MDILKTLTTGSPLQAGFHAALVAADLDTLRIALGEKLKRASKQAITVRVRLLEAGTVKVGEELPDEAPAEPQGATVESFPPEDTGQDEGAPGTGFPTAEMLVGAVLDDIKNGLAALSEHGWTENDIVAAIADMIPGRSKVAHVDKLDSLERDERFPARLLLGELIHAATRQLRLAMMPWNTLPEDRQKEVLAQVRKDCEKAARNALRTFSSEARTNFTASLDNVQFKSSGARITITIGKNQHAHLLADAAGQEVMLVLTENFDMYSGTGDAMRTDPDQNDIFGAEAA